MISRAQVASSLFVAAIGGSLVLSASPAAAEKPQRGCPPSFDEITRGALRTLFPVPGFDELFAFYDKNDDGLLCTKTVPGVFNTIDNTASS